MSSSLFDWYEWGYFSRLKRPLPFQGVPTVQVKIFSYRDKLPRSLLPTASPNLYFAKYKTCPMKYSLYSTKYRSCLMLGSSLPWTL